MGPLFFQGSVTKNRSLQKPGRDRGGPGGPGGPPGGPGGPPTMRINLPSMSGPQVELKKAENAWKPGTKNANADGKHRILCNSDFRLFYSAPPKKIKAK